MVIGYWSVKKPPLRHLLFRNTTKHKACYTKFRVSAQDPSDFTLPCLHSVSLCGWLGWKNDPGFNKATLKRAFIMTVLPFALSFNFRLHVRLPSLQWNSSFWLGLSVLVSAKWKKDGAEHQHWHLINAYLSCSLRQAACHHCPQMTNNHCVVMVLSLQRLHILKQAGAEFTPTYIQTEDNLILLDVHLNWTLRPVITAELRMKQAHLRHLGEKKD